MPYNVTVDPEYRWKTARVGGLVFVQGITRQVSDLAMTDEIKGSSLLVIEEIKGAAPKAAVSAETKDKEDPKPSSSRKRS